LHNVIKLLCNILGDYMNVWGWYEIFEYNDVWNCNDDDFVNGYVCCILMI